MKSIWIDPGHGGYDPGAVNGNHKESVYALSISKKLGDKLSKVVNVYYTRTNDTFVSLSARSDMANVKNVDLFISIHLNSATNKTAKGIETLIYQKGGKSEKLAEAVQKSLISSTGALDRKVKVQNLSVTRRTNMPAILIEVGFISNDEECAKLASDSYQETVANAIYKGVLNYLGINEPVPVVKPVVEETKPVENGGEIMYNKLEEVPEWGKATIKKLVDAGALKGDENGNLNLSNDMLRILVILDRLGKL